MLQDLKISLIDFITIKIHELLVKSFNFYKKILKFLVNVSKILQNFKNIRKYATKIIKNLTKVSKIRKLFKNMIFFIKHDIICLSFNFVALN